MTGTSACREDPTDSTLLKDRILEKEPGGKGFLCVDVDALIPVGHSVEGKTCEENKAVINGHSDKCLAEKDCDKAARLAKFNARAEQLCADWCAQRAATMTTPDVRIAIRTLPGHPKSVDKTATCRSSTVAQSNRKSLTIPANAKTESLGNGLTKANVRFNQRVKAQIIPAIGVKPNNQG